MEKEITMAQAPSQDLKSFIKNNRKFVKIKDGETFNGIYLGCAFGPSRFGSDKEVARYRFKYTDSPVEVSWECASTTVAEKMQNFSVGEELSITRKGATATDTKYEIVAVTMKGKK